MDVYDRSTPEDSEQALGQVLGQPVVTQSGVCSENFSVLLGFWWAHQDLNLEPTDYESAALTVELWARWVLSPK